MNAIIEMHEGSLKVFVSLLMDYVGCNKTQGACSTPIQTYQEEEGNEWKKGGNGNISVELHYAIITSSKLC